MEYAPEIATGCKLTGFLFGPRCGMCRDDCHDLTAQLGSRIVPREHADIIFCFPELSLAKENDIARINRLRNLPLRPPGKFYFVHKTSRGLSKGPEDDCGRLWPASDLFPPYPTLPGGGALSDLCSVLFRPDMIFADIDLGEHDLDDDLFGPRLLGVTLPSGGWTDKHRFQGDLLARFRPDAAPKKLAWFRGKCHGGVRSKCKNAPGRCTAEENANMVRHGGKVSKVRYEMSRTFNGTFGLHGGAGTFDDVQLEWVGLMGECPGIGTGLALTAVCCFWLAAPVMLLLLLCPT